MRAPMSLAKMTYDAATGTAIRRPPREASLKKQGKVPWEMD
jgi:hypothetical protein